MPLQQLSLLEIGNTRYQIAKNYTEPYIKEVKRCVEDYEIEDSIVQNRDNTVTDRHLSKKRYEFRIPYIYSTHESMLAGTFEKSPELLFTGSGAQDEGKADLVQAIYKYFYQKLDLDGFLEESGWWFLLVGNVTSSQDYKIEISGYENVMNSDGSPMFDEEKQEEVTRPIYAYHDPVITLDNPDKTYFSPDSEYNAQGILTGSYQVREKLMEIDEIFDIYDIEVEANAKIDIDSKYLTKDQENDLERASVRYYCGRLPRSVSAALAEKDIEWSYKARYNMVHTSDKILYIEEKEKHSVSTRWFHVPTKFFGFGIGRTLRDVQREMSIRRGQQVRYADIYSYPWLMVEMQTIVDQKALNDIVKRDPLTYKGVKPEYLVPPSIPPAMLQADEIARSDAQFISGTLDLSKGAQDTNTVKTATGQQLFAQSQDKRTQKARKALAKYFKQVVINLFKLARDNWEENKVLRITDEDGNEQEVEADMASLRSIDFDTDIDISLDSISENKNVIAEREIALFEKTKDDPFFKARKMRVNLLRNGFNKRNPESYLKTEEEMAQEQMAAMQEDPNMPPEMPQPQEGGMPDLGGDTSFPLLGNELAPTPQAGFNDLTDDME